MKKHSQTLQRSLSFLPALGRVPRWRTAAWVGGVALLCHASVAFAQNAGAAVLVAANASQASASPVSPRSLNVPGAEPDTEALHSADAAGKWVLGMTLSSSPSYAGANDRQWGLRPVLAGRVGRWMVSTSSARRMADMPLAGGISTTVVDSDRWSLGVGVRLTQGRDSGDTALLAGMPNVPSSLALRAGAHWVLSPTWRVTASLQQDLSRGQGLHITTGLGWSKPVGSGWTLDAGTGVTWANARAMNTFYGVTPGQVQPGRSVWQPGAGVEQWHWGVGASRALTKHWRVAASLGRSTLLGGAAQSPLTLQRSGTTAQVSLAYVGW